MTDSIRFGITFYAIISVFLLAVLWRNSAAPNANQTLGILLSALIPTIIAALPYFDNESYSEDISAVIFFDSQENCAILGMDGNIYEHQYMDLHTNLQLVPEATTAKDINEFITIKLGDLIEKGILNSITKQFFQYWDFETSVFEGPSQRLEILGGHPKSSSRTFLFEELAKIFKGNPVIEHKGVVIPDSLVLPPDSKITVERKSSHRMITISNPYSILKISFRNQFSQVLQRGVDGIIRPDPTNINRYYSIISPINIEFLVKRFRRYTPQTAQYRRWHKNLLKSVSVFDWKNTNKFLETQTIKTRLLNIENLLQKVSNNGVGPIPR